MSKTNFRLDSHADAKPEPRRRFLKKAGALALGAVSAPLLPVESSHAAAANSESTPETLVKVLYDTLTPKQKQQVCFDWDYIDRKRGLLRTRLENNWKITKPSIKSSFFTAEQQKLIQQIFLE